MYTLKTFYTCSTWRKFRLLVIDQRISPDDGLLYCEHCNKPILQRYDVILHHVKELTEDNVNDSQIALHQDNIKVVHAHCHNEIHKRFSGQNKREVILIYGAPCSGYEEYAESLLNANDIIININYIWRMLNATNAKYVKSDSMKQVVFSVRDTLYDCVKTRNGKWERCYVVVTVPSAGERERLCNALNIQRRLLVDVTMEQCLINLRNNQEGRDINQWTTYIEDWYESYSPDRYEE